jgi:tetratricopeptide (TPR) repeat protein/protein involved in polysaccharide export with SLBB domain
MKGIVMQRLMIRVLFVQAFVFGASVVLANDTEGLLMKGITALQQEKHDIAISAFAAAIKTDSRCYAAYYGRGIAYESLGEHAKAIEDLSKAIRLNPEDPTSYLGRGAAYIATGDLDRAMTDLNTVVRLDPRDAAAFSNRSAVYLKREDYDRAIADASRAIYISPEYADAYGNRSAGYCGRGDYDRAIADATRAINLNPRYATAYSNRAYAYRKTGDSTRAIADFTDAIRLDPRNARPYVARGYFEAMKGDSDRALADFSEALRLDPRDSATYANRGNVWCLIGNYDKAIADYTKVLQLNPARSDARVRQAWAEKRNSNLPKAAGSKDESPSDYEFRAMLMLEFGNYDNAIANLQEAIRLNPRDKAAKCEPWPKMPIDARAMRHGQRQVAQMLKDRPALAEFGKAAEPLHKWATRKFAGEDLGEEVFWDRTDPPLPFGGMNCQPTDKVPGCIMVRGTYGGDANSDRKRSFDGTWSDVVFELYNIANASDFEKVHRQVAEGKVSKSQYVVKMSEIECQAAEKTRSFYIHVYLPWAKQHHVDTNPTAWHVGTRADASETLIYRLNRNDPSRKAYYEYHEAYYDRFVAAAKAEKERESAGQPAKQPLTKHGESANGGGRVVASPEESRAGDQQLAASRHIEPLDVLTVCVRGGTFPNYPIRSRLLVEPSGNVNLGPPYGRVMVKELTLDEAETVIKKQVEKTIVSVEDVEVLAAGRATQWAGETPQVPYRIRPRDALRIDAVAINPGEPIAGDFCVDANGKILLSETYGSVSVKGLTIEESEDAITEHLKAFFANAEVSVALSGWKSDKHRFVSK